MAGRGPRGEGRRTPGDAPEAPPDTALVHLRDLAGRPRGTGFAADHHGTVVTSHEAVDGLARLVLHTPDGRSHVLDADAVTPLPEADLALVRTEGLGLTPLPVTVRDRVGTGAYVRIAAGGWREARVLGTTAASYAATDRFHLLDTALELAIGTAGAEALRLGGGAAGGPVIDPGTGAVVAVLGTALRTEHPTAGLAVPLRGRGLPPVLAELLERNASTVPAYGADLNWAGVLELTATSLGSDGPGAAFGTAAGAGEGAGERTPTGPRAARADTEPGTAADATAEARTGFGTGILSVAPEPAERPDTIREFAAFAVGEAALLALVGDPGSGRTTELAALAARRAQGPEPAPTLWLRGADLLASDGSVADAAARALERAGRIVAASGTGRPGAWTGSDPAGAQSPAGGAAELGDIDPGRLAWLARAAGRPLLLLLDSPEEMPPELAHRLVEWATGTADWLRESGARLVVACREEYWEPAGEQFPPELLHDPGGSTGGGPRWERDGGPPPEDGAGAGRAGEAGPGEDVGFRGRGAGASPDGGPVTFGGERLPPCVRLGDLGEEAARRTRARLGIPDGILRDADARHPLTLRLLAEVRAALPAGAGGTSQGPLDRDGVFAAYLDLMCLRIAVRLAAAGGLRGTAVRRLAARVSGQVHEAARRCLGPGQGQLDRAAFESVFPWGPAPTGHLGATTGWAPAVLTEGLLVPAGTGYRFAHEELADWIQGMHLDLGAALHALVHRAREQLPRTRGERSATPRAPEASARRRSRAARAAGDARLLPVPRHRIGPVVQALLLLDRQGDGAGLAARLEALVDALDALVPTASERPGDPAWWAAHLLRDALARVPDATAYAGVLRLLAERIVTWRAQGRRVPGEFGPSFWERVRLPQAERFELLRVLVVADAPPHPADPGSGTPAQRSARHHHEAATGSPDTPVTTGRTDPADAHGPSAARTGRVGAHGSSPGPAEGERDFGWSAGRSASVGVHGSPAGCAETDCGSSAGRTDTAGGSGRSAGFAEGAYGSPTGRGGAEGSLAGAAGAGGVCDRPGGPSEAEGDCGSSAGRAASVRARGSSAAAGPRHADAGRGSSGGRTGPAGAAGSRGGFTGAESGGGLLAEAVGAGGGGGSSGGFTDADAARGPSRGAASGRSGPGGVRSRAPRYLDAVARLLAADPTAVPPHLTRWFDDERPLPATPDATVATAAQALLYAHRRRALDDLTEALVGCAHRRGDELLAVLAEEEPSAMCRAIDRWAHDERPERHLAAMTYGLRTAPHVRTEADRELLRYAALTLLARPAAGAAQGAALALLVRDPRTRARFLPQALERFTTGDPQLPANVLVTALGTHPEQVLGALGTRLRRPGPDVGDVLGTLTDATTPALARPVAELVREAVELCPEAAGQVAASVARRLEHGPDARAVLLPFVTGVLDGGPASVRARLVPVLVAPGNPRSRPLRHELLDLLLAGERDLTVLDALLGAAAAGAARGDEAHARGLVHRAGLLLVRTPDGATRFDCGLVDLAREVPGFAALVAGWLADAPQDWSAVVGPSARRMIENLAGARVPV